MNIAQEVRKVKKFEFLVNFVTIAVDEQRAENQLIDFLRNAHREFGPNFNITDSEIAEFVAAEHCGSGCGDYDEEQGQRLYSGQSTRYDSGKAWDQLYFDFWQA